MTIGAQVAYNDKEGFGRVTLDTDPATLKAQVIWQACALGQLYIYIFMYTDHFICLGLTEA